MTRILALSLVCAGLVACELTSDPPETLDAADTALGTPICSAPAPSPAQWDEVSFPVFQTVDRGIAVLDCLAFSNAYWMMLIDGTKISSQVLVKPELLGKFLALAFAQPPPSAADADQSVIDLTLPTMNVVKIPCGTPPARVLAAMAPSIPPLAGLLAVNLNQAFYKDATDIATGLATGQLCPKK